ncbi:MAG: M23 family metallopeptidase [Sandaracinaceae bacterium]|nr:M23 family metallopeptidase [Sandaracinaceae bacterium]
MLAGLLSSTAHADPTDQAPSPRYDYSRFSDGPRNVPTPRGASLARAQAIGLGTREAASRAMHQPPPEAWLRVAAWRGEAVERLLWPVDDGRFIRGFGFVRHTRPDLRHDGVDIGAAPGSIVRAAADGVVVYSDNGVRGFGNVVMIAHPNGWVSLYAHNARTTVQAGWRVRRGERIALVGMTGITHAPHVHFELFDRGSNIDPLALFDGGPAFVERVAARAHRAGEVPAPVAVDADDRPTPAPLEPSAAAAPSDPARVGSEALVRRLHRFRPSAELLAETPGRTFQNLLWPVRGGSVRRSSSARLEVDATDAPLRAVADGRCVYASGDTVVLLHPMGWVTTYRGASDLAIEAGAEVTRGAWIARGTSRVRVEVRVEGRRVDPLERMVHVPGRAD